MFNACVVIASVELGRYVPIVQFVLRDVAIDQVKRHAPDLDSPEPGMHFASRQLNGYQQGRAVGQGLRNKRQVEEIIFGIAFLLPAVDVQVLAEIAFAIHEAHAAERDAEIACRFQMIARENAEPSGIDRDALVDAEFGRKIGDPGLFLGTESVLKPSGRGEIVIESGLDAVHVREKPFVAGDFLEAFLRSRAEEFDGAMVEAFEQIDVDAPEECDGIRVPAPPNVISEFMKGLQAFGKVRQHRERTDRTARHVAPLEKRQRTPAVAGILQVLGEFKDQRWFFQCARGEHRANMALPE